MKNNLKYLAPSLLILLGLLLSSWGDVGHKMISLKAELSYNDEMEMFKDWTFYLGEHASDPDWRKKDDPSEGPKHYIDIDNYSGFNSEGRIPQSLDSCESIYGKSFVADNGYLPWATKASYDSVVACLVREDTISAMKYAADLGHYVADGHMPMHLTRNYNGQFTDNDGIHFRYEIEMIDRYEDEIFYIGNPAQKIDDVSDYIFAYIYKNYPYLETILLADDQGSELDPDKQSNAYYAKLWEVTGSLTIEMFKNASHALSELLYTAMLEAREEKSETQAAIFSQPIQKTLEIHPNPIDNHGIITYFSGSSEPLEASIVDIYGRVADNFKIIPATQGINQEARTMGMYAEGYYFLVVQDQFFMETKGFLVKH